MLIKLEGALPPQAKMGLLADMVRQAAYESAESLWDAALDMLDMDTVRCFEQALTALVEFLAETDEYLTDRDIADHMPSHCFHDAIFPFAFLRNLAAKWVKNMNVPMMAR